MSEPLRIMLGFVVRRCAVALGHPPTPQELMEWANDQRDSRGRYRIFGRAIGIEEARVILRHPGWGAGGPAAARAVAAAGVIAVVAGSFAAGFSDAVLAAGLPPLEVDAPAIFHTGQRLRLNLEAGVIANLSSGDRLPVRNLTEP